MINGVMQIGIGVNNAPEAFEWYKKHFGTNVRMFDDEAEAALMTKYTGGKVFKRRAILALSPAGGGGFEIWQFTNRNSSPQPKDWQFGQAGINAIILKVHDLNVAKKSLQDLGLAIVEDPISRTFYTSDPYGNWFKFVEQTESPWQGKWNIGGGLGAVLGVGDLDASIRFYQDVFGMTQEGNVEEIPLVDERAPHTFQSLAGAKRAVLVSSNQNPKGFGTLYSDIRLELVQSSASQNEPLFKDRFWGDLGYIHFCYDVEDMSSFKAHCDAHGVAFTVDSKDTFNMEDSGGHFTYLEDPNGTLIEIIQVHKVPIIKKIGLYLDLRKSKSKKVPRWMIKTLLRRQEKPKKMP